MRFDTLHVQVRCLIDLVGMFSSDIFHACTQVCYRGNCETFSATTEGGSIRQRSGKLPPIASEVYVRFDTLYVQVRCLMDLVGLFSSDRFHACTHVCCRGNCVTFNAATEGGSIRQRSVKLPPITSEV